MGLRLQQVEQNSKGNYIDSNAAGATRGTAADIIVGGNSNASHYSNAHLGKWATYNACLSGIDLTNAIGNFIAMWN